MQRPTLLLRGSASERRSEKIVSLEQHRRRYKATQGHAERYDGAAFEHVGHSSMRAFERAMDNDQYARLCRELSGDVGCDASNFLRQLHQVQCWNTVLIAHLAAMAGTIAANILKHSADLLHRATVLAAGHQTGSRSRACLRDDGAGLR